MRINLQLWIYPSFLELVFEVCNVQILPFGAIEYATEKSVGKALCKRGLWS